MDQVKPIEGASGTNLEIQEFAYKVNQTASLFFNITLNGKFSERE